MTALDDLDAALATAKVAHKTAYTAFNVAKSNWIGALKQLGLYTIPDVPMGGRRTHNIPTTTPTITTADLLPLANAFIAAQTTLNSAASVMNAAQTAFTAAQKSSKV